MKRQREWRSQGWLAGIRLMFICAFRSSAAEHGGRQVVFGYVGLSSSHVSTSLRVNYWIMKLALPSTRFFLFFFVVSDQNLGYMIVNLNMLIKCPFLLVKFFLKLYSAERFLYIFLYFGKHVCIVWYCSVNN